MSRDCMGKTESSFRWAGMKLLQASVLGLIVSFSLLGSAAEERAIKSRVSPVYPELAKRMKIEGAVKLEVTVDAEGKVTDVKTVSGNHMLGTAAEDAVRKWRYAPGTGQTTMQVELTFAGGQ